MSDGSTEERLYNLLPAIYRIRDTGQGEPLRALMGVIEEEFRRLERNTDDLYADGFIETCAEWMVPYIGDLLEVRNLHTVGSAGIFSLRAYVANTLRYRRRKGTAAVLEQLARDVTGWPARAVEFFERLSTNQHVNHVRLQSRSMPDLRQGGDLALVNGPFETVTHTAEVRSIALGRGKYNIPNVGLFLWRLQPYDLVRAVPRPVADPDDGRYTFSPLGNDMPLFNPPRTETEITHLAEEINVPDRLRRRALFDEVAAFRAEVIAGDTPDTRYFGPQPAFQLFFGPDEDPLPIEEIVICDLSGWEDPAWTRPASATFSRPKGEDFTTKAAVDPALGRLAILDGVAVPDNPFVSHAYGFSADIGGGPYGRQDTLTVAKSVETWNKTVRQTGDADFTAIADALAEWNGATNEDGVLTVLDNGDYAETISITFASGRKLVIQAAEGRRPVLRPLDGANDLGEVTVTGGDGGDAALTLNGLLIEGGVRVEADSLEYLRIEHCTLVPGRGLDVDGAPRRPDLPSLIVDAPNPELHVEVHWSILGHLRLPENMTEVLIHDSVVDSPGGELPAIAASDADEPGPKTTLERVTVFGTVNVREFAVASETVFTQPVTAQRRQSGCTRFCFVPGGSQVPRRYRCQPDMALEAYAREQETTVEALTDAEREFVETRVTPTFTSVRYGEPAYAQLSRTCAVEIRTGAEDGAEMGVFQHLRQPQREANLRTALDEYLRFGLEAGIFYVT